MSQHTQTLENRLAGVERRREPSLEREREPSLGPAAKPFVEQPRIQPASPKASASAPPQRRATSLASWLIAIGVTAALAWGAYAHEDWGMTPGKGLGYWIGIGGSLFILATLAYPLRKYWRRLRDMGTVAGWFQVHMLLGIFGPAIIIFHANFQLGALNSNVALWTMVCVAASGIVGRYLYGEIHRGLHGRRAELGEMVSHSADMRLTLGGDLPGNSPMWSELERLETMARRPSRGILGALFQSIVLSGRAGAVRSRVARNARRFIADECRRRQLTGKQRRQWQKAAHGHLESYFSTVTDTARLILFERLFALWHVLHVPIFAVMALSVVVHIVAVHFY